MNIKTVSITYERKQNLGDFSSANIGCTLWADITEDDNLDAAMKALWDMATANVKAKLVPLTKKNGGGSMEITETFLGIPVSKGD